MAAPARKRVILLTATQAEADPLLAALTISEQTALATKSLYLGELQGIPVALVIGGCGETNTAHALTCLLQSVCPSPPLVVQAGIAGAFPRPEGGSAANASGEWPGVGDLVLATRETYSDLGSTSPQGWLSAKELGLPVACLGGSETGGVFELDQDLVEGASAALKAAPWPAGRPVVVAGPCLTSSRITGTREEALVLAERHEALAESMEGAAAAHVCALYGVPFLEVRGISNLVGDRDRASWRIPEAVNVAAWATLAVVTSLGVEI